MKAYSLHGISDLRYENVERPKLLPGWCRIKVKAAGICSSDIPRIFKKGTYHFPTIPGHEFSGVVSEVADKEAQHYVGRKVGIFPLIPCKECELCKEGKYELCKKYDYIGSRRDGGFAEYVTVPIWNIIELDNNISFSDAAMMEPLAVSLHAIKMMNIKYSDHVAIIGTGMIAFAAAQWAISRGAESVTIIGRSENKRTIAESMTGVKYLTHDNCTAAYDAVLEAVGSNTAISHSIDVVKPEGRLILMGNPEGDIILSQDTYWKILRKQLVVKGTWNSSYEKDAPCDWQDVKEALTKKTIKLDSLISHYFHQEQLSAALDLMLNHKEPYCKVMTLWNEE